MPFAPHPCRALIGATILLSGVCAFPCAAAVDFVRDVQPIFVERCQQCHGGRKQEAAFRLDHKVSALKGGDFGVAIVPGKADDSRLMHAVLGKNPKMRMPRKGEPLTAEQAATLKQWINEGAVWPDSASVTLEVHKEHWSFQVPVKPAVPAIPTSIPQWQGSRNAMDAFIAAKLAQEGLQPSPPAEPHALCRRLFLDLIGLPPSPAEVDAFENAAKVNLADAVRALSDKLLASPQYGERWGRKWLDVARYADSNGYEKDPMRHIWFYRDWVINAFNRDLPYDQFIIEQIAGDLLPGATQDQIVATGFLRNSMVNEEGGVDPEQFRMEAMFDRMDAIGKSILGLTINCCQCHNHKYDPITQEEYYRMFAFLNNDNEPWRVVYTPVEKMRVAEVHRRIAEVEAKLKQEHPDWEQRMAAWEESVKPPGVEWQVLQAPFIDDSTGGQKMLMQPDGSYVAQSYAPTKSSPKFVIKVDKGPITAFRLELLNDANLPAYGPGRSQKGTCCLTEFIVEAELDGKTQSLKFAGATADFGEPENTPLVAYARDKDSTKDQRVTGPVGYAMDGNDKTAWGIDAGPGRRNVPRNAVFVLEKPLDVTGGRELTISLSMKHGGWNSDDLQTTNLGRFRISCTTAKGAVADTVPKLVRDAFAVPRDKRTPAQTAAIFSHWRTTVADWASVNNEIEAIWKTHPEGTTTLVLDRRAEPRMTTMLKRGDFTKPGDRVGFGVPAVLNPLPSNADGSRLTFARWLADRKSPTTARTFVNRVWQDYFGTGLTATSEDLGTQGETPANQPLLDWLATEFMDNGWSMKALHRLIVTSRAYQQSSRVTPALLEKDPYNRLLSRGSRLRVDGEVVRDVQLAVAGLLNLRTGGPSVMPPAPAYLFEKPVSYAPFPWKSAEGDQRYRRAVYTFRRRSTPFPFLSTFDVPNGETSCPRRSRSNTPLQALMTLNETTSMDAAASLGARLIREGGEDDAARIAYGFRLCTARKPTDRETSALMALFNRQRQRAAGSKDIADAYTVVARVLLNLDETITKE